MTPIYSSVEIRSIDRDAVDLYHIPSIVLMENAARGACDVLMAEELALKDARVVILCGRGNNGGDGLALARHLAIQGSDVACVLIDDRSDLSDDAAAQLAMLEAVAPGAVIAWKGISRAAITADVFIDAMLGTGAHGAPRGAYADAVGWMNGSDGLKVALDLPTGLDADTGRAEGAAVRADVTATMAAMKPGLLLNDALELTGTVYVVHIGVPSRCYPPAHTWLLDEEFVAPLLPAVHAGRHKYQRGKILIMTGSPGMTGAAVLAAEAACRAGAGLTVLAMPEGAWPPPQKIPPEILTRSLPADASGTFSPAAVQALASEMAIYAAVAAGPGLGRSDAAGTTIDALRTATTAPLVLDADALIPYSGAPERMARSEGPTIITPHHGEMARLMGVSSADVGADPLAIARDAARRTGAIVVLKGAPTVVAAPGGDTWINGAGNPGMATGGTGDVLTGTITALVAQCGDALKGTLAGVFLHSLAGDIAARRSGERALIASDIIDAIPEAYRALEEA